MQTARKLLLERLFPNSYFVSNLRCLTSKYCSESSKHNKTDHQTQNSRTTLDICISFLLQNCTKWVLSWSWNMCRGLDYSIDLLLLREVLCLILELQDPHKVTRFHQDKTITRQIGMKSFSRIFLKEQEEEWDMLSRLFNARLNHEDKKTDFKLGSSDVNSFLLRCLSHSKFHISRESLSIFCIFLLCCPSFTSLNHPLLYPEAVALSDKGPCPPQPFMAASAVVMETRVPRTPP